MSDLSKLLNRGEPISPEPAPKQLPEEVVPGDVAVKQMRSEVGARATKLMRQAVTIALEHTSTEDAQSLLDDTIMSMRQAGLSHRKIAAEMGGLTEDEVAERLGGMYARMEQVTSAEYRMLQVGRLEQVINMCWELASQGSPDHIELLVKAIERLNKMFELETEKSKVQVEIVTNAQAVMLMAIVSGIMQVITSDPRIIEAVPLEELQAMTARALDVAEAEILDEDGEVKVLE